jgi:hypothetical protein
MLHDRGHLLDRADKHAAGWGGVKEADAILPQRLRTDGKFVSPCLYERGCRAGPGVSSMGQLPTSERPNVRGFCPDAVSVLRPIRPDSRPWCTHAATPSTSYRV